MGTSQPPPPLLAVFNKEEIMPIIFVMWAVPALIFVGGVGTFSFAQYSDPSEEEAGPPRLRKTSSAA